MVPSWIGKEGQAVGDGYFLLTNLLSEDEKRVITSITAHIERGEKRVGIQQIANENFLSTTTIVKMCKRLGFDGYSELYYYLSRQFNSHGQDRSAENIKSLIDNYSDELLDRFCGLLDQSRRAKLFTTGEGFSNIVGAYIAQRLSICGFMVFNNVHFYDYMLFRDAHHLSDAAEAPPVMFAVSQSGETEPVLNDVRHAKQHGHKIVAFTRRGDSKLAQLSDLVFVVDGAKQTLAGSLPKGAPQDTYRVWTSACKNAGARVFLDADGALLAEGLKAAPYLIKPNDDELSRLAGKKLETIEELTAEGQKLLESGIERVVISLGGRGALYLRKGSTIYAEGLKVPVGSTVGAGDSVVAALAYAESQDMSEEDAVRLSTATGAANVMCSGTQAAERSVIEELLPKVRFSKL